jgi:Effector Associated Constant Component 1
MSEPDSSGRFELAIDARNDAYDPADDRWRDQVLGLHSELQAAADTSLRARPVAGTKGSIDELIVSLGSAGAFTAAVECLRAWLGRDRSRRLDVRWNEGGVDQYVTLSGDAIDVQSVREIAKAAATRVGGPAWPAATEPS